jgi:hypothetical protein
MQLAGVNLKGALFVVTLLSWSFSAPVDAQTGYKNVSVCEILAQPKNNNLQKVAVDADLLIARPHGVVLVDQRCPGNGLLLDFPSTAEEESVAKLEKAIRRDELPLESTGRFCGNVSREPKSKRFVLSLRLVLNLQPKSPSTAQPGAQAKPSGP